MKVSDILDQGYFPYYYKFLYDDTMEEYNRQSINWYKEYAYENCYMEPNINIRNTKYEFAAICDAEGNKVFDGYLTAYNPTSSACLWKDLVIHNFTINADKISSSFSVGEEKLTLDWFQKNIGPYETVQDEYGYEKYILDMGDYIINPYLTYGTDKLNAIAIYTKLEGTEYCYNCKSISIEDNADVEFDCGMAHVVIDGESAQLTKMEKEYVEGSDYINYIEFRYDQDELHASAYISDFRADDFNKFPVKIQHVGEKIKGEDGVTRIYTSTYGMMAVALPGNIGLYIEIGYDKDKEGCIERLEAVYQHIIESVKVTSKTPGRVGHEETKVDDFVADVIMTEAQELEYISELTKDFSKPISQDSVKAELMNKAVLVPEKKLHFEAYTSGECTVFQYYGEEKNIVLPELVINKLYIKEISFVSKEIESIVLPDTVTMIGNEAFRNKSLKSIYLSKNLKTLGKKALCGTSIEELELPYGLTFIGEACFAGSDIKVLSIPDTVTEIEQGGLRGMDCKELVIPGSVKEIKDKCFSSDSDLETVVLMPGVESIGEDILDECINIKNIYIPASVNSISQYAFDRVKGKITIITPKGSYAQHYADLNGLNCEVK